MSNTFGDVFKLTTYGESHGVEIGGIIDGCPSNIVLDFDEIQNELNRRKPGQSNLTTQRKEEDIVLFNSGIFNGKTTGTPIHFKILNKDSKSKDYTNIKDIYRPSHADYTYQKKYGIRDYRGGGRSSARETACRVVAGAVAKQLLVKKGIIIRACVDSVYKHSLENYKDIDWAKVESLTTRAANLKLHKSIEQEILEAKKNGDSLGGTVYCEILNSPVGLGEPVFDKFNAKLGFAILGINAVKGFEIGLGFNSTNLKGSEHNDSFYTDDNTVKTKTNNSGGVLGGITNGEKIYFRTAFKPTATIIQNQETVDKNNNRVEFKAEGRHDPCVLPRAIPIVEAMTALTVLDFYLKFKSRN